MKRTRFLWAPVVLTMVIASCGGSPSEVRVSAAASLTDAFAEIETAFEATHPGIDVVLNFGGSSALREQIIEGAPVDVFASANMSIMDSVVAAGEVVSEPRVFASNLLEIAVPPGNPGDVAGLVDFSRAGLLVGLCAEGVPCGDFGRNALEKAGVVPVIDSNEPDVRALLTKIELGELDAGIVYATDVESAGGRVEGVEIPASDNVIATYPIAVLVSAPNPRGADAFLEFVLSDPGQAILSRYGFAAP
ncbi:MAG: molybdate ABC transporter substrate-binding protein [Acidimicrobiia bacterium]